MIRFVSLIAIIIPLVVMLLYVFKDLKKHLQAITKKEDIKSTLLFAIPIFTGLLFATWLLVYAKIHVAEISTKPNVPKIMSALSILGIYGLAVMASLVKLLLSSLKWAVFSTKR